MNKIYQWLLLLMLVFSSVSFAADSTEVRPNVIFILTDDQRYDSVGFMGNRIVKTPNLDQLASEGVVFDNAYVTSAICTPSRACYMLGQYERRHGINFNSGTAMSPNAWAKSYPVLLRKHGYFTGYVGKNHLPIGERGYQTGLMEASFDFWYAGHHHLGFYPKEFHSIFDNAVVDTQPEIVTEGALGFIDPGSNEAFLGKAKSFLNQRPQDQPFCLSICMNLPHSFSAQRMQSRATDDELYRNAYQEHVQTLPLVPYYIARDDIKKPRIPSDVLLTELRQQGYDWVDRPESARKRMIRFMQAISGIDRMLGVLRKSLRENGLSENTVIIFASDHGLFMGDHGLGGKALCYETAMKIPFLIYDPRSKVKGRRVAKLVASIDVAPTILGLAKIEPPVTMQGRDLQPLLNKKNVEWRDAIFGENLWSNIFGNPRCETVRTEEYRYIRYFKNENLEKRLKTAPEMFYTVTDEIADDYRTHLTSTLKGEKPVFEELFQTRDDPHEANNLANDPRFERKLFDLRHRCDRLLKEAKGGIDVPPDTIRVAPKWTKTLYRDQK